MLYINSPLDTAPPTPPTPLPTFVKRPASLRATAPTSCLAIAPTAAASCLAIAPTAAASCLATAPGVGAAATGSGAFPNASESCSSDPSAGGACAAVCGDTTGALG